MRLLSCLSLSLVFASNCSAQAQRARDACPRPAWGAMVSNPPELQSYNGTLEVSLHLRYEQTPPSEGPPRYCYVTDDGLESPTLRVHPGDHLIIHLHNDLKPSPGAHQQEMHGMGHDSDCSDPIMDLSTTNLHFHGMTIPPSCHQDDVIHAAVHAGETFDYDITIPADEPPGLYWYHPHPHGFSERQVQGGASGAIIVEGIEHIVPSLAELRQRVIVLRDQQRIGPEAPGPMVPSWDVSINFVPVVYPDYLPARIEMASGEKELWRVVNAAADTIFNLQVLVNQIAQPVQVVAIDGVPLQTKLTAAAAQTSILLPPGARVEFVVTSPGTGQNAKLVTQAWNTGPSGDNDCKRTIAEIVSSADPKLSKDKPARRLQQPATPYTRTSLTTPASASRLLYFSQHSSNAQDPDGFVLYFITVAGQTPAPYKMGAPPNIIVHQGDVEDWTIENRTPEDHVFHIHQIHFQILAVNGRLVSDPTMRDTIDIPFWTGEGQYPSVTLRMDFTDPNTVGTFLYHCHILKHEDMGMMGSIQVLPPANATAGKLTAPVRH